MKILLLALLPILFQQAKPPQGRKAAPTLEEQAIERVNFHRKSAGLGPVTLDLELSKGCTNHAKYLITNAGHPSLGGLGAHDEEPKLPGFTESGRAAARSSDIAFTSPPVAVDEWMNSLFHRLPILSPNLRSVGIGYAKGGRDGWTCLMDVIGGKNEEELEIASYPVLYPADKQKDIRLEFPKNEYPDPIPGDPGDAGYPVTAMFAPWDTVVKVDANLKDAAGKAVGCYLSTPEKPADARFQRNSICLFPKDALKRRMTYTVAINAVVNGKPWSRTWTFATGGS